MHHKNKTKGVKVKQRTTRLYRVLFSLKIDEG
jgi:hypothetical protein